jgi:toxin ParE1/3/4
LAIAEHYRPIDPDLASMILRRLQTAPLILTDHPDIGAPTGLRSIRKWRVRHTPFILFYSADRARVEIKRVRHAAENWQQS